MIRGAVHESFRMIPGNWGRFFRKTKKLLNHTLKLLKFAWFTDPNSMEKSPFAPYSILLRDWKLSEGRFRVGSEGHFRKVGNSAESEGVEGRFRGVQILGESARVGRQLPKGWKVASELCLGVPKFDWIREGRKVSSEGFGFTRPRGDKWGGWVCGDCQRFI